MESQFNVKTLGLAILALAALILAWQVAGILGFLLLLLAAFIFVWRTWLKDPFGIYPKK